MILCPRCSSPCGDEHTFCFGCGAELASPSAPLVREDPLVGRTLPGGYRVTHMVGVGGMGRVYCAEQVALGRTVAVKVVHPHLADDELTAARFLNEARTASRLSHPNTVAIFDFGRTEQGQPYIVMEYLRGRDLGRVSAAEGPLPLRRITDVLRQTLAALGEAHALAIVHRDLKPDNIVLEPLRSGLDFVKVVDFGLAKVVGDALASPGGRPLTRPGLVCGTPEYMSPEQGRGDALDGRADLYAVGVVLFELLTGRAPFAGGSSTGTLLMHINDAAPDPRSAAPERAIPAAFAEVALRALEKAREDRYQDAREFSTALNDALFSVEGRRSSRSVASARCASCGAANGGRQRFCGHCGAPIASDAAPRPQTRVSPTAPPFDSSAPTLERPAVGSRTHRLPLVARSDALAWLETRRHDAEAMLAAAHVIGDVGYGKTRLVTEFLERCTLRGDLVVSIGPDPAWARVEDTAVRSAVAGLAGLAGLGLEPGASPPLRANALAARGLEVLFAGRDDLAVEDRRAALAEALRWGLERAGEGVDGKLVVLWVDDLDFLDGTSRNAVADVLAGPPVVAALLVVAYAPASRVAGEPLPGETWTLGPLPAETFTHVVPTALTGGRALPPLHVEQLMAWAHESREAPPERLADLVSRRGERLSGDARHALQALAVWGDDASAQVVARLLPGGVDLGSALDELDRARMIVIDERAIRIAHPLVRRVAFSNIPAGRKRELFARAEELRPDAPLEVRAKQAMHGGSAFEALSLLDVLSTRRAAHGDLSGSISALRHALDVTRRELHRGEIDDPVGAMLVFARKLAEALAASRAWNDADGVLREALGNAPPASEHRVRLLGALASVASARSNTDDARRYIDEAMRVARQSDYREVLPLLESVERSIDVA